MPKADVNEAPDREPRGQAARDAAARALENARLNASAARDRAAERVATAPLMAVAGGLAVGAVLAAILPRTERERQLLGPAGTRLTDSARGALDSVREAGTAKLAEIDKATIGDTIQSLVSNGSTQTASS